MAGKAGRRVFWAVLAVVPALALIFGAATFAAPKAEAATVSASLGVGCAVKNGDVKLSFSVSAQAKNSDLNLVQLTVGGNLVLNKTDGELGSSFSEKVTVDVIDESASYLVVLTVESDLGNTTKTALATVTISGSKVSCKVKSPA